MANTTERSGTTGPLPVGNIPSALEPVVYKPTQDDIEKLAYKFWNERDNQKGSAEANWFEAERELRAIGPHA
jgi:Protein of unknown function (DUF2934)